MTMVKRELGYESKESCAVMGCNMTMVKREQTRNPKKRKRTLWLQHDYGQA